MKTSFILVLILAGCASSPTKFSAPAKDARGWDLNVGRWPGTNDLLRVPSVDEAANAR